MSLLNLIFIFDIDKKKKTNSVSEGKNVTSTKLKFNFVKFLTMIKISISQHFFIKTLFNISIKSKKKKRISSRFCLQS